MTNSLDLASYEPCRLPPHSRLPKAGNGRPTALLWGAPRAALLRQIERRPATYLAFLHVPAHARTYIWRHAKTRKLTVYYAHAGKTTITVEIPRREYDALQFLQEVLAGVRCQLQTNVYGDVSHF